MPGLRVKQGMSAAADAARAAAELCDAVAQDDPALVLFFCSSHYDLPRLAEEIGRRMPGPVYGCTTAGEITPAGHASRALVGVSLASERMRLVPLVIPDLHGFDAARAQACGDRVNAGVRAARAEMPAARSFGLLLVDGLSVMEEQVVGHLYRVLDGVPIVGGSAGDDLRFSGTHVYADGRFLADAALLLTVVTEHPFCVFKTQHFEPTSTRVVITRADPGRRRVHEINGEPAAEEYARLLGLDAGALDDAVFSRHPLMLRIGGEWFARSIRGVDAEGGLDFYCAIDEGLVLTLARAGDLVGDFEAALGRVRAELGPPALVVGFECVQRRAAIATEGLGARCDALARRHNLVGFHTYGEQYNAVHINQTLTGVALGS